MSVLEARAHEVAVTFDEECLKLFNTAYSEYQDLSFENNQQCTHFDVKAFDLVILDIELPKRNEIGIAQEIYKIRPNQRILLLSTNIKKLTNSDLFVKNNIETMENPVAGYEIVGKVDQKGNTIRAYN